MSSTGSKLNAIADAFVEACRLELDALKPGNVHRHAEGHGMTCADFEISAQASAPELARLGERVGARIYRAVAATKAVAGKNTNLGILLLCAPLAASAERGESLKVILETLTLQDAQDCFAAIAAANPGGLGLAATYDVRAPATAPLLEAMAAAAHRDLIARQYANGFADIADLGLSRWRTARAQGQSPAESATSVYLSFLRTWPDSHIARKFGAETAEDVRRDAEARVLPAFGPARRAFFLKWDAELKARGLNPGTCADLTVATLFAAFLTESVSNALRLFPYSA
jgi:triphosphoribosyl-dephospho-CoA synthase